MSNKLFVKKQIRRILTWFFSYDKLTKLKSVSKDLFNNKSDDKLINLQELLVTGGSKSHRALVIEKSSTINRTNTNTG